MRLIIRAIEQVGEDRRGEAHEIRAFNICASLIEPAHIRSVFEQNTLEPDSQLKEYDQARAGTARSCAT